MEQNNSSDLLLVIDMQNVYTKGQEWACPVAAGISVRFFPFATHRV